MRVRRMEEWGRPPVMSFFLAALLATLLLPLPPASEAAALPAVTGLRVTDVPDDDGSHLALNWDLPAEARAETLIVLRMDAASDSATEVARLDPGTTSYQDGGLHPGTPYRYEVRAGPGDAASISAASAPVAPRLDLFNRKRLNAFILFIIFCGCVLGFIASARGGRNLFIRRIAGLNALDEAIGRATEMGRKIFYIPGIMSMDEIQTVASLAVLKHVAKKSAGYQADLEVPNKDPLTFAAARETVKEAYLEAGRPDLYREEMVNYVTYDQFAYTATLSGRMVRERPAANLFIGSFYAESLLLAETGQAAGAIQIAGTAEVAQLPFFVCACDYTMIGEELYAASAYLSRDPVTVGSIKGQDYTKLVIIIVAVIGIALESFGWHGLKEFLVAQ